MTLSEDSLMQVDGITQVYPGLENPVLSNLSLRINGGEALAIMGPSGSGKSTLLHLMAGLETPSEGRVLFESTDLSTLNDKERAVFRNQHIGLIFQDHHLLPQCTAMENVLIPTLAGKRKKGVHEHAQRLFELMKIGDRAHHRPAQLSGGERQRVAIARSLINQPTLLLADEPSGSLDDANSETVMALLQEARDQLGLTLLVVTHAPQIASFMDRTYRLVGGGLHPPEENP